MLTTVNAALQRVPARDLIADQSLSAAPGNVLAMDGVTRWLELNGYNRTSTVREPGDYAVRGGIIDLYRARHGRAGAARLLRRHAGVDPQLRSRDPALDGQLRALDLVPVAEFQLTTETIRRFRTGYVEAFGAPRRRPALRGGLRRAAATPAWSTGCRCSTAGSTRCSTICRAPPVVLEPLAEDAAHERLAQIADYYEARRQALEADRAGTLYKPLPPDRLYLGEREWKRAARRAARWRGSRRSPIRTRAAHRCRHAPGPQLRARARRSRAPTCSTR